MSRPLPFSLGHGFREGPVPAPEYRLVLWGSPLQFVDPSFQNVRKLDVGSTVNCDFAYNANTAVVYFSDARPRITFISSPGCTPPRRES
jgi:hypothetical protein